MPAPFYPGQPDWLEKLNNLFSVSSTYYGPLAADPSTRPDGSARQVGDRYYNTTAGQERTWSGSAWSPTNLVAAQLAAAGGGALVGNTPAGGISATTVQAAINELDAEKASTAALTAAIATRATPADITAAINTLIAAAPGVLDTLDELAAALGDDPNFAATMTAALAGKATIAAVQAGTNTEAVGAGTADAITGTYTPAITALTNGLELRVRTPGANAIAAPTFKADGTTLKTIVKGNGVALAVADAQGWLTLRYDSTLDKWVLLNPATPAGTALVATSINGGSLAGLRNRIINGDMRIDQRFNGAVCSTTGNTYTYGVDRHALVTSYTGSLLTSQQVADAPPGFKFSTKFTVVTQRAALSAETVIYNQVIEGNNIVDFQFGTASAQPITYSFWVKGSVPGNYTALAVNGSRSYVTTFPVTSSWVRQSITFPGETTGAWLTDNGGGLYIGIDLGSGSGVTGSPGSWQSTALRRATGTVGFTNQVAGSTLNITGVQLELGSVATPFEQRPYGLELALCQRYYQTIPGLRLVGQANNSTALLLNGGYATPMRASATHTLLKTSYSAGSFELLVGGGWVSNASASLTGGSASTDFSSLVATLNGFSGLTPGQVATFNTGAPIIAANAEL
jgi:hypothetical protein